MPLKWIPRSKSGASKSQPLWAAHTRIGNVWEYPPRGRDQEAGAFKFRSAEEVACVASVSSRGSSRKLGQEQKKNE